MPSKPIPHDELQNYTKFRSEGMCFILVRPYVIANYSLPNESTKDRLSSWRRTLSSTFFHRWRSLSSSLFLALWLSLSCIGQMANVKEEIFLLGPKSTLWLETFFQCRAHSNGKHLRSGDENIVRDRSRLWSSAQYPSNALCRFWYYFPQRVRDINDYFKLVRSRHRPSRPKIQYLLQ